ncbi:kinase-like protein [Ceratobasidium sp. AG-I]|nr:kinase-like protein [Ceratobasidium sp. AG-I]
MQFLFERLVPSLTSINQYTFSVARFNYKDLVSGLILVFWSPLTWGQLCDVLQGLAHIHQLNLAHGDLKPENIVLTAQSKRLTAKICDFGSARDVSLEGRISIEYTSTALYRSPELATEEEEIPSPSFAADVWAFGCVAFVVQYTLLSI